VANRVDEPNRAKALELAEQASQASKLIQRIHSSHGIVNYPYWKDRCHYERDPDTVKARELVANANQANFYEADMLEAKELYEQALAKWRVVIDRYNLLETDEHNLDFMMEFINNYSELLNQLGEKFPDDFILQDVRDEASKNPAYSN
jgi:hypothetical protein